MTSRAKGLVAIVAVLLNLFGSPMAWAQVPGDAARSDTASAMQTASEDCHGHARSAAEQSPAPDSMPCCDDGSCHCAAATVTMPMVTMPMRLPQPTVTCLLDTSALPANPLDDSLRPPIR